jgi:holo-[acyl-carrier protein] synthase
MSIIGHGVDLVDIAELRRWIEDPRDPLIPRCFQQAELDEIGDGPDRIDHLAGRFAAKEAVLKALGVGFGGGIAFTDVIIHRDPGAPPEVRLARGAAQAAAALGVTAWRLSISHAGGMAMASALALGNAAQADSSSHDGWGAAGPR